MKNLGKTLPMLAVLLGLGIFLAQGMANKAKINDEDGQAWGVIDPLGDLTDPANYEPYPGTVENLAADCPGEELICGIIAPSDEVNQNRPDISDELKIEIEKGRPTDFVFYHN